MAEKLPYFRQVERKERRNRYDLLQEWYGDDEYAATEMAQSSPQPINCVEIMEKIVSDTISPEVLLCMRLKDNWSQIVGSMLNKLTRPEKISNGTLFLGVRHSALLRELEPSLDLILAKLREFSNDDIIRQIKLVIADGRQGRQTK